MILNKKLGFAFLLLFGLSSINCKQADEVAGIQFETFNFDSALEKADKEGKLIFLDAYASWCGPCKFMSKSVFTDPAVGEYFNKNFVNMKIDMEKGEGPGLARRYQVQAYPTMFIINSKGQVVAKQVGALDAQRLIAFGKSVKQ